MTSITGPNNQIYILTFFSVFDISTKHDLIVLTWVCFLFSMSKQIISTFLQVLLCALVAVSDAAPNSYPYAAYSYPYTPYYPIPYYSGAPAGFSYPLAQSPAVSYVRGNVTLVPMEQFRKVWFGYTLYYVRIVWTFLYLGIS